MKSYGIKKCCSFFCGWRLLKLLPPVLLCLLCLLGGCGAAAPEPKADTAAGGEIMTPPGPTLVAVGDNLLHLPVIRWCQTTQGYDFSPLYAQVKDLVSAADIAFVNQEGPVAGADVAPSGYPEFNAPPQAGLALAAAGFSVISQANNHSLDQGLVGLSATADFWQGVPEIMALGLPAQGNKQSSPALVTAGGYTFAWLAYSYGSNKPLPGGYAPLNPFDKEIMAAAIAQARAEADAVIVSMHWGEEYQHQPTAQQQELARFLAGQGVLLVIGHHPHVVQPLEWIEGSAGGATLVAYSLGNFISSQSSRATMLEAMLSVEFGDTGQGLCIEKAGIIPLVMHYERNFSNYAVFPLAQYTEPLASRHYVNTRGEPLSLDYLYNLAQEIFGEALI